MATQTLFKGFTPQTIQFLNDLHENNYKEWFEANRDVYENELLNPFKDLVNALAPIMCKIDPRFELRPQRALSRIYRDVRFSKDKTPYKTSIWMAFQIPISRDDWQNYPGYYLELTPTGYSYGMGYGMAKKKVMDDFRDRVTYNAEQFKQITQKTVLDRGFKIAGEEYKRPLVNDLPEYFQAWIQKKTVWVMKEKPIGKELFSSEIVDMLKADFEELEWLYNFLKESQP